jgi:hypothetical protein
MKETVWLHIGTNKTGSTAIQLGLRDYDDGISRYARLGRVNHSVPMSILFRHAPAENSNLKKAGKTPEEAEAIAAQARQYLISEMDGPAKALIISAESMSDFSDPAMCRVAAFLAPRTKRVRVLAYVRDPAGYASSSFQQRVKGGSSDLAVPRLTLRNRLEPSIRAFGSGAMEVVAFNRETLGSAGVLTDAARRMNLNVSPAEDTIANASLSPGAVGLLYFWNRSPDSATGNQIRANARTQLIAELGKTLSGRFRLSPDLVRPLVDASDLKWLFETFGIDFRGAMDKESPSASDIASEDDLSRARDAAFPALVALLLSKGVKHSPKSPDEAMTRLFELKIDQITKSRPIGNWL